MSCISKHHNYRTDIAATSQRNVVTRPKQTVCTTKQKIINTSFTPETPVHFLLHDKKGPDFKLASCPRYQLYRRSFPRSTNSPKDCHKMNIFRFFADLSHMFSCGILLYSIEANRSVDGLSLKTQVLYVVVFALRYVDLFYKFVSLYNTLMKVFFIATSAYTVYLMTHKYPKRIREATDTFPVKYLCAAAGLLCLIFTHAYSLREITWSFSIWLEALAIIPQLFMLQKTGSAENITTHYIFALGIYRGLYIPNWLYRYFAEGKFDYVAVLAGIFQTIIYSDFFYIYYTKVMQGKTFELPV